LSEIQQHHNDLLKFFDRVEIQDEEKNNAQTSFDKMKVWEIKNNMHLRIFHE
jgi:hypothetical protein